MRTWYDKNIQTKLYVAVVTLSTQYGNKLLEQLKTGFKRTIKWKKYWLKMTYQAKSNNLNYFTDTTSSTFNRLFVLAVENEEDKTSISRYTSSVEIKDFNVLINGKSLFDVLIKKQIRNIRKNYWN